MKKNFPKVCIGSSWATFVTHVVLGLQIGPVEPKALLCTPSKIVGTSNRVTWKGYKVITDTAEAREYTPGSFIGGSSWLGSTGFPFSLGL